jgi:hypothetical protein
VTLEREVASEMKDWTDRCNEKRICVDGDDWIRHSREEKLATTKQNEKKNWWYNESWTVGDNWIKRSEPKKNWTGRTESSTHEREVRAEMKNWAADGTREREARNRPKAKLWVLRQLIMTKVTIRFRLTQSSIRTEEWVKKTINWQIDRIIT